FHGAGERGSDNISQLAHGSQLFLKKENQENFPAVVIFPQCPKDDYWANVDVERESKPFQLDFHFKKGPTNAMKMVMSLLDSVSKQSFIKKDQIYVAGLSMGGMGTFEILARKPEMFAAAIAICGAANPKIASNYRKGLPIRIFHGLQDDIVAPEFSKKMAAAINKHEGNASLRLYKNANHNSWDSTFMECDLLEWLFSNTLKN
ncbi:MAG: prolyl oligopeptidase family serine peptidase, partial [Gillisia sp.]